MHTWMRDTLQVLVHQTDQCVTEQYGVAYHLHTVVAGFIFFCATFYLNSSEFGMTCMKCVQKSTFGRNIYVRSNFCFVSSSYDLCVRANAHSLEGTLIISMIKMSYGSGYLCSALG